MRFVHTDTLEMVERTVKMEKMPPYGILSHRWEEEEVDFQEMQTGQVRRDTKGFQKILRCSQQAKDDGLEYIWVDTCCIDKTSSSELQEALNSMFQWYQKAAKCYAYLFDVQSASGDDLFSFRNSVWFQRGWTLQELLAPTRILFYGQEWRKLGDKESLRQEIAAAAGIRLSIIDGEMRLQDVSVAERMSWASRRDTAREEDQAYSLLGIFNVSMPMLYGEGKKAFIRLQEEIIKRSDDHTIFAWQGVGHGEPGMLAKEPASFVSCKNMTNVRERKGKHPYSITNRGLSITLSLKPYTLDTYLAVINCNAMPAIVSEDGRHHRLMGILLRRLNEDDQYGRVRLSVKEIFTVARPRENGSEYRNVSVNVCQAELSPEEAASLATERVDGFQIDAELLEHDSKGERLFEIEGNLGIDWDRSGQAAHDSKVWGIVGVLDISKQKRRIKTVTLGFDFDFNPVCLLGASPAVEYKPKHFNGHKSIHELIPHDLFTMNKIDNGVAWLDSSNSWALKGDRLQGLDVLLTPSAVERLRVTMKKKIVNGQIYWVFGIHDPGRESLRIAQAQKCKDKRTGFAKVFPL